MIISGDYTGCRAFVRYSDNSEAIETIIVSHNKEYMTISLKGQFKENDNSNFVNILIMQSNSIHEYRGKLRRSSFDTGSAEIALFRGQIKEDRASKRYTINAPAVVENVVTDTGEQSDSTPIDITVNNLSTTGVLIVAQARALDVNNIIQIRLTTSTNVTTMNGQVVRIKNVDDKTDEYGCKIVAAQQANLDDVK